MAKKKAKVKKRPHNRPKRAQANDPGVKRRQDEALTRFDLAFRKDLPQDEKSGQVTHSTGSYVQVEGDKYDGKDYPIADGQYRVQGSDYILTFEGGGFVEASKAEGPDYGGDDVIAVVPVPLPDR